MDDQPVPHGYYEGIFTTVDLIRPECPIQLPPPCPPLFAYVKKNARASPAICMMSWARS